MLSKIFRLKTTWILKRSTRTRLYILNLHLLYTQALLRISEPLDHILACYLKTLQNFGINGQPQNSHSITILKLQYAAAKGAVRSPQRLQLRLGGFRFF